MADDPRIDFLTAMARALTRYGTTADELERGLGECAEGLGMEAEFFAAPTSVFAGFGKGAAMQTVMIRTQESGIDLDALSQLDTVLDEVTAGRISPGEGLAEIDRINAEPLKYRWPLRVLSYALGAASVSVFIGGAWRELAAAIPVGLVVGVVVLIGRRAQPLSRLLELLAGLFAAITTLALGHILPTFNLAAVVLAGLILLVPGLTITQGVAELASRHLLAGSSRLAGAMVTLVNLGFGVALGYTIFERLGVLPATGVAHNHPALPITAVAVLAGSLALMIATNAAPRDFWPMLAAVAIALSGARLGVWLFGPLLGVAVASLILGLASNLWARLSRRPAAVPLVPGLVVLVPGALGFRGVSGFLNDATGSLEILAAVMVISAGLVVGLLVADATLPPRTSRRV